MRKMREAVIVATARTGMAKSFRGSFNQTRPDDMAAHCIKALLQKVPQLDPKEIDDVVMGTGFPEGPQGFNVGRNVAVIAGLPHDGAGLDRQPLLLVGAQRRRGGGAHGRERGRRGRHRRRPRVDHDAAERLQQEQPRSTRG